MIVLFLQVIVHTIISQNDHARVTVDVSGSDVAHINRMSHTCELAVTIKVPPDRHTTAHSLHCVQRLNTYYGAFEDPCTKRKSTDN